VAETERAYIQLLITNGVEIKTSQDIQVYNTATGVVSRIAPMVVDGNSLFFLKLQGDTNIYQASFPALLLLLDVDPGDEITVNYSESNGLRVIEELEIVKKVSEEAEPDT